MWASPTIWLVSRASLPPKNCSVQGTACRGPPCRAHDSAAPNAGQSVALHLVGAPFEGAGVSYRREPSMPKLARFRAKHATGSAPVAAPAAHVSSTSFDSSCSILHVDMDAFFVSVELLAHPELRGRPVVVGGQPDQRGVVSAASYEARRYGIHSAMPLRTAGRLCPHAVFLDGHHEKYGEWSDRVATILAKFSPVVEMVSIDEAYLDLSGTERLHGPPLAAADKLLRTITQTTALPCSAGLATTRLVAKVASDQAKPRGLVWVAPGREARFLAPLPVRKIPGIGEVTEGALRALGIETVEQIAAVPQEKLETIFGQWGTALRSEEHTSELQSLAYLVCRLLLEKKK